MGHWSWVSSPNPSLSASASMSALSTSSAFAPDGPTKGVKAPESGSRGLKFGYVAPVTTRLMLASNELPLPWSSPMWSPVRIGNRVGKTWSAWVVDMGCAVLAPPLS